MSWKSLSFGKAKSSSNQRQTTNVVTTTFTNFDARYQTLKADVATLMSKLHSCLEGDVSKSLLGELQLLSHDVRTVANKFEGQPSSLEWKQLLLDVYKCILHCGIKISDHFDHRHDLFLLGLQSLTLMEDLQRKDVGLIRSVLETALLCEDRWTYNNLLAQYSSCFMGLYQALLGKTREAVKQLPYSHSQSVPVIDSPIIREYSSFENFEAPNIATSAVAVVLLQRLLDSILHLTTLDAKDQLSKLRNLITSVLSDNTLSTIVDFDLSGKDAAIEQSKEEFEKDEEEQAEQDRMMTRCRGPIITPETADISESNSLQNNVDEVLATIFERWLQEEHLLLNYDNLEFIQATFAATSLDTDNSPQDEEAVREMDIVEVNANIEEQNPVIDFDWLILHMQTTINTLNSSQSSSNHFMILCTFEKQLLDVLALFSQYLSSLSTTQMKQIVNYKIFHFQNINLAVITLYANIISFQQQHHLIYDLALTTTVFALENAVNILDSESDNSKLNTHTCKLTLKVVNICLQHISTCNSDVVDVTWKLRILWVGCRLSLSKHGHSYSFQETRMDDLFSNLQVLSTMISTEVSSGVSLPFLDKEHSVVNALTIAKLINKCQTLSLQLSSSSSSSGSSSSSNSAGVKMMNEIVDTFDLIKLEHYLLEEGKEGDRKSLSAIEVLHTYPTWQGLCKVLSVFTAMAKKMSTLKVDAKLHILYLKTLFEVITILQQEEQKKKNQQQTMKEVCTNLITVLQVYMNRAHSAQEMEYLQHVFPLVTTLDAGLGSLNVVMNACLECIFSRQKSPFTPANGIFIFYQILSLQQPAWLLLSLSTKKAVIRSLCMYHLPNVDCAHALYKDYLTILVMLVESVAYILSDFDILEFVFYVFNNLGDHGADVHDHLPTICRILSVILVTKLRLLEKEMDGQIVEDKVYDAYLVLANCYRVSYNLPLTSYSTSSAPEEVTLSTAANMYRLVSKCANLRDFTKQDIRDSLLWILDLNVVKQALLIGRSRGGKWKEWLLHVYNYSDNTQNVTIPVYNEREEEQDVILLSHIFYDLLDLGLVVSGPESLCKQAEFLSLIEAYPFLRCLERNAAMDVKLKQSVEYAVQDLYFHPWRLESWSMLVVKFQDAALSLTDMLHETVDYFITLAYFNRKLVEFEVEYGQEKNRSEGESIWKMDPECWVNDIIPWVDRFYRYITTDGDCMTQFNQWKVESYSEETFLQRLIPNKMARFYCFKDFPTFVKGLLFTYRLKHYFDMAVHKTYAVIIGNDFQQRGDQEMALDTSVLHHSLVEIKEAYGLSLSFLAKDYPRRSEGRKRYVQQALSIYQREEVQEESIFAAVFAAKWLWQLHRHEQGIEAMQIIFNVRKKLVDDEQIVGKTYRVHAWYHCHSLSSKFALWILFRPFSTSPPSLQILKKLVEAFGVDYDFDYDESNCRQGMAWIVLIESVRHLIDCRKRDLYHFRTHFRLSDIIFKLSRAQIVIPEDVKSQLKVLLNIPDINYQAALNELHTKLFDKKRQQIVAMWAVDTPNHGWDQMTARVSEFDSLRRKFIDRYLLLAKLCGEVEMIYNLAQQTFGKLSTATLHYITHQSITAMLAAIPIKLQSTTNQEDPVKSYLTKLSLLELVYSIHLAMNKRKYVSPLISAIESCLRELLIAISNDSATLIPLETAAVDLTKPSPEVAASGLKAVQILVPQQAVVATTAAETAMDVVGPATTIPKTMPIITLTFNHSWGNKEVLSQVAAIMSLQRKLSQSEGAAGSKRGRGGAAKEQRESGNEQSSNKTPRLSQADFIEQSSQQQQLMQVVDEDFEEQVMLHPRFSISVPSTTITKKVHRL